MEIFLENVGRRYNREWIFRDLSYHFESGRSYAILGPNGSGKSTLLQVLAGNLGQSEGNIRLASAGGSIPAEDLFRNVSLAAPYLELIEEFTLVEHINFHFKFKPYRSEMSPEGVIDLLKLHRSENKQIKYFSSGMKQRLKLALAFCADTSILLLDEPTSNLDQQGIDWYRSLAEEYSQDRMYIVASNQPHEYEFCELQINVLDHKPNSAQRDS